MTAAEVQQILGELDRRLGAEVGGVWRRIAERSSSAEFRRLVIEVFPEVVAPYSSAAAEIGAAWYDAAPSTTSYRASTGVLPESGRLQESAAWALNTGHGEAAITLLRGTATRAMMDGFRETVIENVAAEPGARWARYASATACGFCRMVATRHVGDRATFYTSEEAAAGVVGRSPSLTLADRRAIAAGTMTREQAMASRLRYSSWRAATKAGKMVGDLKARRTRGTQELGDGYHDHCRCLPQMIRPGQSYEPPAYYEQWQQDYFDAIDRARAEGLLTGRYGQIDPKVIARLMDPH